MAKSLFQRIDHAALLLGGALLLAALAQLAPSHSVLVPFVLGAALLSLAAAAWVARDVLLSSSPGLGLLLVGVFGLFWVEAIQVAIGAPAFAILDQTPSLPVPGPQWPLPLVKQGLLQLALFQMMLWAGHRIRLPLDALRRWVRSRGDRLDRRGSVGPYALAAAAFVPLLVIFRGDVSAMVHRILADRGATGVTQGTVYHPLVFLGMFGLGLLATYLVASRSHRHLPAALLALAGVLLFYFDGARHLLLFIFMGPIVFVLVKSHGSAHRERIAVIGSLTLLALLVFQLQAALRAREWRLADLQLDALLQISNTNQFSALMFADWLVPARHPLFFEPMTPYFLIHFIPRFLWPGKPSAESWAYYNDMYTSGAGTFNVTPSAIGQYHLNWGLPGVLFIGLWLGLLARVADDALAQIDVYRQRAMIVAIAFFYGFLVSALRFYSPVYFTYAVFALLGALWVTRRTPDPGAPA